MDVRIKQKVDTSSNWFNNNPVLLAGEMGVESDTGLFKFGDGATAWNSLQYALGISSGEFTPDLLNITGASFTTRQGVFNSLGSTATVQFAVSADISGVSELTNQVRILLPKTPLVDASFTFIAPLSTVIGFGNINNIMGKIEKVDSNTVISLYAKATNAANEIKEALEPITYEDAIQSQIDIYGIISYII